MNILRRAQKRSTIACFLAYFLFMCAVYTRTSGLVFFSIALYGVILSLVTAQLINWVEHYQHFYSRYKQIKLDIKKEQDRLNGMYERDQARHIKSMREWNAIVEKAKKISGF